jgi:hypothetical protein
MCRSYKATLHYDPSQAYLMMEQIRKAHVHTQEFVFTSASVGRLATDLMQALRGRLISLPKDEALRDEILSVRLRESSPNVLRIDHASGKHDDRVVAVAMAASLLSHLPRGADGWMQYLEAERRFGSAAAIPPGYFDEVAAPQLEDVHDCEDPDCPDTFAATDAGPSLEQCVKCKLYREKE